eukprot:2722974-Pyramimonas_sp.AAC.1
MHGIPILGPRSYLQKRQYQSGLVSPPPPRPPGAMVPRLLGRATRPATGPKGSETRLSGRIALALAAD